MATWKKIVVSGSNISQLANDSNYLASSGQGILSSSAQIATDISGSITATSASLASSITTEANNVDVVQSHVGNIHSFTASIDGEVTSLMAFTASAARGSAISGSSTALSASLATRITTEENNVDVAQAHIGNIHSFTASADSEISALMAFTASAARNVAISGSSTALSASLATRVTDQETFSSSLDATFATEAELLTVSQSLIQTSLEFKFPSIHFDIIDLHFSGSPNSKNICSPISLVLIVPSKSI